MTYTNTWSNSIPPGSDPANTIDDSIRQVRLDLDERLLTLVKDMDNDPLQGVQDVDVIKNIHWSEFVSLDSADEYNGNLILVNPLAISQNIIMVAPILHRTGDIITEILGRVNIETGAAATLGVGWIDIVADTFGVITTAAGTPGGGFQDIILAISETVLADRAYFVYIDMTNNGSSASSVGFMGIKETYTIDDIFKRL